MSAYWFSSPATWGYRWGRGEDVLVIEKTCVWRGWKIGFGPKGNERELLALSSPWLLCVIINRIKEFKSPNFNFRSFYYIILWSGFHNEDDFLISFCINVVYLLRFSPVGTDFPRSPESSVETETKKPNWKCRSLYSHN